MANQNFRKWLKAAGIRAVKTMAQTAVSLITVGSTFTEVNWIEIVSISVVAGIYSVVTSFAGLPEVKETA